jgi:hypothetical protein
MARLATANDIINRVAVEIGLNKDPDPVSSPDEAFIQMKGLLDSAGQELVELHNWQIMSREFSFTTQAGDTGIYDLPDDFSSMVDQTGWDRTNRVAIGGPLSDQDWAYLEGRDLVSQSIYVSFKLEENKLYLYPQPPPEGLEVSFQYASRSWVAEQNNLNNRHDVVETGSDVVLYEPILIVKFLKVKMLEAKGFDASAARLEFENMMDARTGKDTGASILSASNNSRGFPYLHPYYNTGDTGFGAP